VKNIGDIIGDLENSYSSGTISRTDGLRVDFGSWWFIVRSSSAEPVLRLVVEAETEELMQEKVSELSGFIEK
jgi:phosphomannomutase